MTEIFIVVLIIALLASCFSGRARYQRQKELVRLNKCADISNIQQEIKRIVLVDFGYGGEMWAIIDEEDATIDHNCKVMSNGLALMPKPSKKCVRELCLRNNWEISYLDINW